METSQTLWLPEGVSTLAPEIDRLFYFVTDVSIIIFVGVVAAMVYFMVKYRRRGPDDRPEPVKESKIVEISWVVIPTILVLIVFTWGFQGYVKLHVAPTNSYEIQVRGYKWGWEFTYPNGVTSAELHVPVDRPVRLQMSSSDVIHSFYIPVMRVKQDVLPNRYSFVWFEATKQGSYDVFCTEYCGTAHSGMITNVVVESQQAFNQWVQTGGREDLSPLELGEALYTQKACATCHSLDGSPGIGPSWEGIYLSERPLASGGTVIADVNYLRESIIYPNEKVVEGYQPIMPPYANLTDEELNSLITFIKAQSEVGREELEAGTAADGAVVTDDAAAAATDDDATAE